VVSESGLYTLVLRCRDATTPGTLPHRFRRWVTGTVLSSIRNTGGYAQPAALPAETVALEGWRFVINRRGSPRCCPAPVAGSGAWSGTWPGPARPRSTATRAWPRAIPCPRRISRRATRPTHAALSSRRVPPSGSRQGERLRQLVAVFHIGELCGGRRGDPR
jgi:hypothetical protein